MLARIARARANGARGHAAALSGDPVELPQLLAHEARRFLKRHHRRTLAVHPCGSADLILLLPNEPPNGRHGSLPGGPRPPSGEALCCAAAAVLRPGGCLVISKSSPGGALPDLRSGTLRLCEELGLQYWQHVVALIVPVREGQLRAPRRRAAGSGEASHADVFVFRKPSLTPARPQAATAEAA